MFLFCSDTAPLVIITMFYKPLSIHIFVSSKQIYDQKVAVALVVSLPLSEVCLHVQKFLQSNSNESDQRFQFHCLHGRLKEVILSWRLYTHIKTAQKNPQNTGLSQRFGSNTRRRSCAWSTRLNFWPAFTSFLASDFPFMYFFFSRSVLLFRPDFYSNYLCPCKHSLCLNGRFTSSRRHEYTLTQTCQITQTNTHMYAAQTPSTSDPPCL